jgi:hypothetical protein
VRIGRRRSESTSRRALKERFSPRGGHSIEHAASASEAAYIFRRPRYRLGAELNTTRTLQEIKQLFHREFSFLANKFILLELHATEAWNSREANVAQGGVYVWWKDGVIYKVGRSMSNSRKRAFEHRRDNTAKQLRTLIDDPSTVLLLFNARHPEDLHWVLALEDFLEKQLDPKTRSRRRG